MITERRQTRYELGSKRGDRRMREIAEWGNAKCPLARNRRRPSVEAAELATDVRLVAAAAHAPDVDRHTPDSS
jgi:hypothetical protein